jgi:hypothetical protein
MRNAAIQKRNGFSRHYVVERQVVTQIFFLHTRSHTHSRTIFSFRFSKPERVRCFDFSYAVKRINRGAKK